MKRTVAIFCEKISMGGTETLILRLLKWYKNNNYRTILLTLNKITNESILKDFKVEEFEHYVYNREKNDFLSEELLKLSFNKSEEPLVLTQYLPEFLKCFSLLSKSKYKCCFRHTIYIVHPYSTFLTKKIAFLNKKMISILLRRNILVFMDETCLEACVQYYKFLKDRYQVSIYRLPVFISEDRKNLEISKNELFNILTISRFEFPFKGYVLGLIKSYVELFKTNPNISLTIIGYGKDKYQIEDLLIKQPEEVTRSILILDEMPYRKINDYIEKCDVYVGMGTTILDAANMNKIGIIAVAYQSLDFSYGFFHENYNVLGEVFDPEVKYESFYTSIKKVIDSTEEEFYTMSVASKNILRKYYNIDRIANQLWSCTKQYFTFADRVFMHLFISVHRIGNFLSEKLDRFK